MVESGGSILPEELAGDLSSRIDVARLAGSAVVHSPATTALTTAWMLRGE
jgi:hypothetical protein